MTNEDLFKTTMQTEDEVRAGRQRSSRSSVRAALFGTGRIGTEVVRGIRRRPEIELVAAVAVTPEKEGSDLGEVTIGERLGVSVTRDLDRVLRRDDVDVVLHAGLGTPQQVGRFLGHCADAGKDAITVSGLVHPEVALGSEAAQDLHDRACRGQARLVGTGVNPGFVLDSLPAMWGSMVSKVDRVFARRVSEIRQWGEGVLESEVQLGQPVDQSRANRSFSLNESLAVIVDALGLSVDRTEDIHEPLAALTPRSYGHWSVAAGATVGFRRRSVAYCEDCVIAAVEWTAIFCIDPAVDGTKEEATLRIEGDANVEASATGTFCGDPYPSTAARAINAIAPLLTLPPGLYRPDALPAFSAIGFR